MLFRAIELAIVLLAVGVLCVSASAQSVAGGFRVWTDASERYTIEARFVRFAEGKVYLKTRIGAMIAVTVGRFSKSDQEYVRDVLKVRTRNERKVPASRDVVKGKSAVLEKGDLQYVGAFRVPTGEIGESTFSYGGAACAFNGKNSSLFIVGHDNHQAVAEIDIPRIIDSGRISDLETAAVRQPFVKVLSRIPKFTLEGAVKIGGLLVVEDQLVGTAYEFYDADENAADSHFRLTSLDLGTASCEGLFRVGNQGGGLVAGYMTRVPDRWREPLSASYLTGQAALNIIGRTSSGPSAFGFAPDKLGDSTSPALPYLYYPIDHQTLGWGTGGFNGTSRITGIAFPPGSRSILYFGSEGVGEIGYGEGETYKDPYRSGKGYHSQDGKYEYRVWAYDVLDFVAAKNGKLSPWNVRPYKTWSLEFPNGPAKYELGGVAFDAATRRLYVSQVGADRVGYDSNPLIHVFALASP